MAARQHVPVADGLHTRELRVPWPSLACRTRTTGQHWRRLLKLTTSKMRISACWCSTGCQCSCCRTGRSACATNIQPWACTLRHHTAACVKPIVTPVVTRHNYTLARMKHHTQTLLSGTYEVASQHTMNAVYQRAAGVATAKVADLRVRGKHKHVPGVAPTDLWLDLVVRPGGHATDGARAHRQLLSTRPRS
jgi:hypothetical protein